MKHLILDVNIVVDACTNRSSSVESVAAIAKAKTAWPCGFMLAQYKRSKDSNLHETKLDEIKAPDRRYCNTDFLELKESLFKASQFLWR